MTPASSLGLDSGGLDRLDRIDEGDNENAPARNLSASLAVAPRRNVIETHDELSAEDAVRFRRLISGKEYRKLQDLELTYFDKLELKGVLRGKRETLLRQLTAKFGPLPEAMVAQIETVTSASELDTYLDRVLTARSLEETGFGR